MDKKHVVKQKTIRLTLRKQRLNSGGYLPGRFGKYFGNDGVNFLYWYSNDDGDVEGYIRAVSRVNAKAKIRKIYSWFAWGKGLSFRN